ncbi:hypothetical protein B0H10DRAFT_2183575 [Mycena sp. CBHHK59/15]|nr:hypothetical protein B0H10DRAFT_2183575 [Mycena sp. CBHHK59/15]
METPAVLPLTLCSLPPSSSLWMVSLIAAGSTSLLDKRTFPRYTFNTTGWGEDTNIEVMSLPPAMEAVAAVVTTRVPASPAPLALPRIDLTVFKPPQRRQETLDMNPFLAPHGQKGPAWQQVCDDLIKQNFCHKTISAASLQHKVEALVSYKKDPNGKHKNLSNIIREGTSASITIGVLLERLETQYDASKDKTFCRHRTHILGWGNWFTIGKLGLYLWRTKGRKSRSLAQKAGLLAVNFGRIISGSSSNKENSRAPEISIDSDSDKESTEAEALLAATRAQLDEERQRWPYNTVPRWRSGCWYR